MTSQAKKYHAFISHSSQDKDAAKQLALDLQGLGYSVWFDEWKILVGHNIVDEVFGAIKQSHFMVVILSEASIKSRWVDEELTAAKTREIEDEQVVILPARLENCEIPPALAAKRYADFTGTWDHGVEEIARAIDGHSGIRPNHPVIPIATPKPAAPSFDDLDRWREDLIPEMIDAGFVEGQAYKDVLIGPIESSQLRLDNEYLKLLIDVSRAEPGEWDGPPFPYENHPNVKEQDLTDGLRYVDTNPLSTAFESFFFWQVDPQLRFFHRCLIEEDFRLRDHSGTNYSGTLSVYWALLDLRLTLTFAKNCILYRKVLNGLKVKFIWTGLSNRYLYDVKTDEEGFSDQYRCRQAEWTFEVKVTLDSDISEIEREVARSLFAAFGFHPELAALESLIQRLN